MQARQKIVNDPVHGFISIPTDLAHKLIEHPYFQRLRNIKQLGLSHVVYPGAVHTRFQHTLGAMHLMSMALDTLRAKGHPITDEEAEAAQCAILLHDIGHGPYSHAMEFSIIDHLDHEDISMQMMQQMNRELNGRLDMAIAIFTNQYPKHFLHSLISGQLDVDRLDYLRRDSFFSGVVEGAIGLERIIRMLEVCNDELVVEAKGLYSIEKFLIARRLMYLQVYLHKTSLSAEQMLIQIFKRAKELAAGGKSLFASPSLAFFLNRRFTPAEFRADPRCLAHFAALDDSDVLSSIKVWQTDSDPVLSLLSRMLVGRKLNRLIFAQHPFETAQMQEKAEQACALLALNTKQLPYFVYSGKVGGLKFGAQSQGIDILNKDGSLQNIFEVSDLLKSGAFTGNDTKYFLSFPCKKV